MLTARARLRFEPVFTSSACLASQWADRQRAERRAFAYSGIAVDIANEESVALSLLFATSLFGAGQHTVAPASTMDELAKLREQLRTEKEQVTGR